MPSVTYPCVFLDVSIGTEPVGRLVIELFIDKAPKTCENFRALCTGSKHSLSYSMAPFHRIIDGFVIQGGDITKGDGTGGVSIYGDTFEDENTRWREIDMPGLVCMANGGKNMNSSQFFITLAPCLYLTGKHTVFGHLMSGQNVINRIVQVPVDKDDRPKIDVLIARCGEMERPSAATRTRSIMSSNSKQTSEDRGRRKRRRSPSKSPTRSESPSRGHTRSSGSRHRHHYRKHHHVSSSPSPTPPGRRNRRRSDASLDHNIRGRPRQRSRHRTRSPILESVSPPRHRRKRSQPPSRRRESNESGKSPDLRRQRSLPNLYNDDNSMSPGTSSRSGYRDMMTEEWFRGMRDAGSNIDADHAMGDRSLGESGGGFPPVGGVAR